MRRLALAITTIAMLAGTSAFAQDVTSVIGDGSNVLSADGEESGTGDGSTEFQGNRANFSAFHDTVGDPIVFESSHSLAGGFATNVTTTSIDIGIDNPGGAAFGFQSTITAAGMGFYVADTGNGCILTGTCAQGALAFGDFAHINTSLFNFGGETNLMALASFKFDVVGFDGIGGETLLYNREGFTALRYVSPGVMETVAVMDTGVNGGVMNLNGFGQADDGPGAFTYTWDATNFGFTVGGDVTRLRYRSTVTTETVAECLNFGGQNETCIISFAAFGDPIGRDGDADLQGFDLALLSLEDGGAQNLEAQLGAITGINGERANFTRPQFVGGNLYFQDVSTAAIPEPATWAMMIMGFGFLGTAMRRRRAFVRA